MNNESNYGLSELSLNILRTSIIDDSAIIHLSDILNFAHIATHQPSYSVKIICYFLYRLYSYVPTFNKEDALTILENECKSSYLDNETTINKLLNKFSSSADNREELAIYQQRLDIEFSFIQQRQNRNGDVAEDNILKKQSFFDYLIDVFKIKMIEKQPSIWNGNGYKQGIEALNTTITKLAHTFNFEINSDLFIKQHCTKGLRQVNNIDYHLIPCLDKVVRIDSENLDFEHLTIENHVTSKPTVNPLQITLGDIRKGNDLKQAFFDKETDNHFNEWANNDPQIRALLEETLGLVILHSSGLLFRKAVILHSKQARTGKTTFCNFVCELVGQDNISFLALDEFGTKEGNRFKSVNLVGKRLNFGDETAKGNRLDPDSTALLKKIISSGQIQTENKGVQGTTSPMTCFLLFACNDIPYFNDDALEERFLIIPFLHAPFTDSTLRIQLNNKEQSEKARKHFFYLALVGALRLLQKLKDHSPSDKIFTYSTVAEQHRQAIKQENDPLFRFILENKEMFTAYDNEYNGKAPAERTYKNLYLIKNQYIKFIDFCNEGNYYQKTARPNKNAFTKKVCDVLKMKVIKADFRNCQNSATAIQYKALQPQVFSTYDK